MDSSVILNRQLETTRELYNKLETQTQQLLNNLKISEKKRKECNYYLKLALERLDSEKRINTELKIELESLRIEETNNIGLHQKVNKKNHNDINKIYEEIFSILDNSKYFKK